MFIVIFGILFIFKKYIINIEVDEVNNFKDEDKNSNVDIIVGEEDSEDNYVKEEGNNTNLFDNIEISSNDNINNNDNININNENELSDNQYKIIENIEKEGNDNIFKQEINEEILETGNEESTINKTQENVEGLDEEIKSNGNEIIDQPNLRIENDNMHELDDELSLDEENFNEDNDFAGIKTEGSAVKQKFGMDVSYEELAKAIRTKLKRDEE